MKIILLTLSITAFSLLAQANEVCGQITKSELLPGTYRTIRHRLTLGGIKEVLNNVLVEDAVITSAMSGDLFVCFKGYEYPADGYRVSSISK